jgi:hypothetical protein
MVTGRREKKLVRKHMSQQHFVHKCHISDTVLELNPGFQENKSSNSYLNYGRTFLRIIHLTLAWKI